MFKQLHIMICNKKELASLPDALQTFNTHFCKKDFELNNFSRYERVQYSLENCENLLNLDSTRLKASCPEQAYPATNRPRGIQDILSVKYHVDVLQKNPDLKNEPLPIVAVLQNGEYETHLLLDGAHRFVAAHLLSLTHLSVIFVYLPITIVSFR